MTEPTDNPLDRARELRRNGTMPEKLLWGMLRGRRLASLKFRRQMPVGKYIVDFACVEHRLIVEVDGDSHDGRYAQDSARERVLNNEGWKVFRVSNDEVLSNLEGVLFAIVREVGLDPRAWDNGSFGRINDRE
jgi:very-short-patch-repair endonuclease